MRTIRLLRQETLPCFTDDRTKSSLRDITTINNHNNNSPNRRRRNHCRTKEEHEEETAVWNHNDWSTPKVPWKTCCNKKKRKALVVGDNPKELRSLTPLSTRSGTHETPCGTTNHHHATNPANNNTKRPVLMSSLARRLGQVRAESMGFLKSNPKHQQLSTIENTHPEHTTAHSSRVPSADSTESMGSVQDSFHGAGNTVVQHNNSF